EVDIREYFVTEGVVTADRQREREYTKLLSERIVERYFKENIVLPSHLAAFAAFHQLRISRPELDLYGLLRLPTEDYVFDQAKLLDYLDQLKVILKEMAEHGKLKLSEEIDWDTAELLKEGVSSLGTFHPKKPLVFTKKGALMSQDFKLLYYYQNRLTHYGLEQVFDKAAKNVNEPVIIPVK
ncbi:MAG: glycerol acyltransferase, partial [Phaeodactylibacter sp.]|nr:glycerol acyltransferase [Phaeodactylibacter sp.]